MSSCCPADVKVVTKISPDGTITAQYLDMRIAPPVMLTQAAYDALVKVKCPTSEPDWEKVCLQVIGNADAALIESGDKVVVISTTFADTVGAIDSITRSPAQLYLEDGTDVTATHEVVACPEALVVESDFCVAP